LQEGDVLNGNYALTGWLGSGNVGEVWRARHVRTEDRVAIKLVRHDRASEIPRLGQEYAVASSLRHPNIVKVIARDCTAAGRAYIVMEVLEGEPLSSLFKRLRKHDDPASRVLSVSRSYKYLEQLVSGLAFAHRQHIVHRDLKPGNVFLTTGGGVKIADFGLAKDLSEVIELTGTGAIWMGTEPYMAPEQKLGFSVVDQRVDIYPLAAITCEMLTGTRFSANVRDGQLDHAAVQRCLSQGPLPIPGPIVGAILKALSSDPEHRQGSVEEFFRPFEAFSPEDEETRPLTREEQRAFFPANGAGALHAWHPGSARRVDTLAEEDRTRHWSREPPAQRREAPAMEFLTRAAARLESIIETVEARAGRVPRARLVTLAVAVIGSGLGISLLW
jgi:serine/threonine-protein kinase